METIFSDLINGNLKEAKARASAHRIEKLTAYARDVLGWSEDKAAKAALYLRGYGSFQDYCDAE